MGMSTHCVGFRPADKKWNSMKKIWEQCEENEVPIPDKVLEFFDHESPEDRPGMEIELGEASQRWGADMRDGYEIDVTKLPEGIRLIRVYNSY